MKNNTCDSVGCKNEGDFIMQQLVGKKQIRKICCDCAPEWVINGDVITTLANGQKAQFYEVTPMVYL